MRKAHPRLAKFAKMVKLIFLKKKEIGRKLNITNRRCFYWFWSETCNPEAVSRRTLPHQLTHGTIEAFEGEGIHAV